MRASAPVPKSNPVAHTMMSNSRSPSARLDPALGHAQDRRLAQVDEVHVRLVVHLEVAGHERRPLLAEAVVLGDQLVRRLRILDDAPDLAGDELAPLRVRRAVEHQVAVVAGELREAGAAPHGLEERLALLLGVVEGGALVGGVEESAGRRVQGLAHRLEVLLQLRLLLGRDRCVVERRAPVGGALVDRQGGDLVRDGGDDLHAARPGADDRDPLAGEVDRRRRPQPGVVRLTPEVLASGHVRVVGHREDAGGGDQEPRPDLGAVAVRDRPARRRLVVDGGRDPGPEADVAPQVEPVHHVVEVALGLRLFCEVLLPLPFFEQLPGEQVGVGVALGVEPRPG